MQPELSSAEALLAVSDLSAERDGRILFKQLAFNIFPGGVTQLEGPNGAGKTTLLRIIAGLNSDYHGQIVFQGLPIKHVRYEFARAVSWLGHQAGIKPGLNARENLQWTQALTQQQNLADIDEALDRVGLFGYEDVPVQQLSAGQQRRVALARLYLSRARLWILDEPFTAIDKAGVSQLEQLLYEFSQQGGAVLLTTHHKLNYPGELQTVRLGEEAVPCMDSHPEGYLEVDDAG